MTVQINYKSGNSKKNSSNLILFVDEKFNISGLKKEISNSEFEICFFKPLILNFSSTNKTRFDEIFFELLLL